ncbi:MAG: PKD domain-containing protein [Ignavibacteriae bacterium]|nr:PKD domain-containing protein [Ignavibacteriota bacterium]
MKTTLLSCLSCLVFFIASIASFSQCMQYAIPLAERIGGASTIIEGKIVSQKCFPAGRNGMIYTSSTIEVYRIFKGLTGSTLKYTDIVTQGGTYQNERVSVSPSIDLQVGQTGLFFLQEHTDNNDFKGFEPYSWQQCYVQYDEQSGRVSDVFTSYPNANYLYNAITGQLGNTTRIVQPYIPLEKKQNGKSPKTLGAVITSFSPTYITAGTDSSITIRGSGFGGEYSGQAAVAFSNADDGGVTMFSAAPSRIVSWTDNVIVVKVPYQAGTGRIRVTSVDGTQATTSAGSIIINYAITNVTDSLSGNAYPPYLVNANETGGYTLTLNSSFATNNLAVDAFKIALRTWRCNTFINVGITKSQTALNCVNGKDGINVVSFDDSCTLPVGVISLTYRFYNGCNISFWSLREFDMIFSKDAGGNLWNYAPTFVVGATQIDFQSTVLHEIGHVHQLGHIIGAGQVMHYKLAPRIFARSLGTRDIAGGAYVINRSINKTICAQKGITRLTSNICDNPGVAPSGEFIAVPLSGCAPLTVNFIDQSTDSTTLWNWDFTDKGLDNTYTKNPSYTYSEPGKYSVKFTAANALGSKTTTKLSYITVYALPTLTMGKSRNACLGSTVKLGEGVSIKGTAPYTYRWSPTDFIDDSTLANPTASVSTQSIIEYTLTITDAHGCSDTKSFVITPVFSPTISAGNNISICKGDKRVVLGGAPTASGGTPPYSYLWTPATGLDSAKIANPTANPSVTTKYLLTVSDKNGGCQLVDSVVVTVTPASIKPTIIQNLDTLFSSIAATYQWRKDSVIIPNETKQFLLTTIPGRYTVTVTTSNPCPSTSSEYIIKSTGVLEVDESSDIRIYPNPTDGNVDIQLPFTGAKCRITNVLGMVINEQIIYGKDAKVSLLNYPAGMYYIEFTTDDNQHFVKVITKD